MILNLLKFEWKFHLKQNSFLAFFVLIVGYGILAMVSQFQFLERSTMYNDAYNISVLSGIISLLTIFATIFFCVNALLKDTENHMDEIIFSTGISKFQFFISRYFGVFSLILLLSLLSIFALYLGAMLGDFDPKSLHDFNLNHYLWASLTFIFPNVFITTSLLFCATLIGRKAIVTYITGIILVAIFWFSGYSINSPLMGGRSLFSAASIELGAVADLLGLAAFYEQTQFLTPVEKNDYLVNLSGLFLANRIVWITISFITLFSSYALFSFRKSTKIVKNNQKPSEVPESSIPYSVTKTEVNTVKSTLATIWQLLKIDFLGTLKSTPFQFMIVIWTALLIFSFDYSINSTEIYGNRYPTTDLLVGLIIELLPVFGFLLIVFYSAEIVWKSRAHKFNEIIDATPAGNKVFFGSKLILLILIPMVLIMTSILIGIIFQIYNGYYEFNLALYMSQFYYGGMQLLLYGVFALFIQSLVNNKYLGMVITAFIILLCGPLSESIGLEHPLLLFNNLPSMARAYSDFTGYGHYTSKFNWMFMYWFTFSGILILLSYKFWKRGVSGVFETRVSWLFAEKLSLICLMLVFIFIGGFVYYQSNVLNDYISHNHTYDFNEQYERKYKKFDQLPVPQVISINTIVELYPNQNKYSIVAKNRISNNSGQIMHEIFVTAPVEMESLKIENATQQFHDSLMGTYLFKLNTPLLPKQQLDIEYRITIKSTGFNIDNSISANGSYIKNPHFKPLLGYVNRNEISDPFVRKSRGLPAQENPVINDSHLHRDVKFNFENVEFESIISTENDQLAFTSGNLIKQWKQNNRNYFHYKSDGKIDSIIAYFSARYQVEKLNYKGLEVELYYLPQHYRNVAEMLKITKATIDYCNDNFGSYPHKTLRIGEMPTFAGSNGQAMPGVIGINERIFKKSIENPDAFNVIARVLIHEISHQWWGFLLTPKQIEGAMVLSESLAKYSETVILKKLYGKTMVRKLSEYSVRKYFSGRSYANKAESPLYLTEHQQYLGYSKGAVIMNAIGELIGVKTLNSALNSLLMKYHQGANATTLNLIDEIYAVTANKDHKLINDWMKRIITYDISIKSAFYTKLDNNTYEITAHIFAERLQTDSFGKEHHIDIDEDITIEIFKDHPKSVSNIDTKSLYLKPHHINKKEIHFKFIVNEQPKYLMIDPNFTRLDRNLSDNLKLIVQSPKATDNDKIMKQGHKISSKLPSPINSVTGL